MSILNDRQINQKVTRLAYEIIEHNIKAHKVFLAGINNNGYRFAQLLMDRLQQTPRCPFEVVLLRIVLDPARPTSREITVDIPFEELVNQSVILVDDVANTGRTLFYAFSPFMPLLLKKLQVAVLVDRKHKAYPIRVDYVGLSLATTIKDHIEVNLTRNAEFSVQLS